MKGEAPRSHWGGGSGAAWPLLGVLQGLWPEDAPVALLLVRVGPHLAAAGGTPEVSLPRVHTLLAEALVFLLLRLKNP